MVAPAASRNADALCDLLERLPEAGADERAAQLAKLAAFEPEQYAESLAGRKSRAMVPWPGRLSSSKRPPFSSAKAAAPASPRPLPP